MNSHSSELQTFEHGGWTDAQLDQAIAELGRLVGISDLALDERGNLGLLFDGAMPINIARTHETAMELWSPIEEIAADGDAGLLRYFLAANHLGEGTGPARIGLQPDSGDLVLCERIEVAGLDATALERRFIEFVKHAIYWNSQDARDAAFENAADTDLGGAGDDFGIHV